MEKSLTIVKVCGLEGYAPTTEDLERWAKIFKENSFEDACVLADSDGNITVEKSIFEDDNTLTLVKVGDNPSLEDLEAFRKIFEEARYDKDFTIFTHSNVQVDVLKLNKIVAVE